jgi:exodeoxyribonuclease VII small subunit
MADPADLTYEQALAELEAIVTQLERGEVPLDETITRFERGVALARRCEDRLQEAERRVALLLRDGERVLRIDAETGEQIDDGDDDGEA